MDINFELYKIFYHAANAGSFSEAGQRLFVSQSAVSQAVKNLEEKIGRKLFYRINRNVMLTTEGELLYRHVEQAYNFIKSAENKLLQMESLEHGEIRIGASDTVCRYFLVPYLKAFYEKYPKIKIKVINRTSPQIIDILKSGLLDAGIVTMPVDDKRLEARPFITVEDAFIASEHFCELKEKKVSVKELADYPLLMLQKNSATRRNLDKYFSGLGISAVPEIELESIDLLVEFCTIGLGVAHVLKASAQAALQAGEVFEVKTKEALPARQLGIITMKNFPLSKACSEFMESLTQQATD